jgi:MOSC domain-containing protein YiiM
MENTISKILSIQIGKIKTIQDESLKEKQWTTGSFKEPIDEEVTVTKAGIIGDEVADLRYHGGEHKAIFANSYENYPSWREYLGDVSLTFGALAENITLSDIKEEDVYIGDIHQIGEVILEVSQPREPCWKISKKHKNKTFTKHIYDTGRTGWYYRVLQEGKIKADDTIVLTKRLQDKINILEANNILHNPFKDEILTKYLLGLDILGTPFRDSLEKRYLKMAE